MTQARDWTCDPTGRANSSDVFERLVGDIARMIRSSAGDLLTGDTEHVARLILARLAHHHGLAPRAVDPAVIAGEAQTR